MFTSNHIAKKALERAEVINKEKESLRRRLKIAVIFCICLLFIGITTFILTNTSVDNSIYLTDDQIPLASPD